MRASLRRLVALTGLFGAVTLMADEQGNIVPAPTATIVPELALTPPASLDAISFAGMNDFDFGTGIGRLHGNVTFDIPVTAGSDVVLAPGNSPGTMTFTSGLTLASGGSLAFEVQNANGSAGSGYDLVRISGGLLDITATSASPFTIRVLSLNAAGTPGNVFNFSSANSYSWMLYQANSASGITGFDADKFTLDLAGFTNPRGLGFFSLIEGTSGGNPAIFLNFTAVPEPSTYALMALGLGAAVIVRRRRR